MAKLLFSLKINICEVVKLLFQIISEVAKLLFKIVSKVAQDNEWQTQCSLTLPRFLPTKGTGSHAPPIGMVRLNIIKQKD